MPLARFDAISYDIIMSSQKSGKVSFEDPKDLPGWGFGLRDLSGVGSRADHGVTQS